MSRATPTTYRAPRVRLCIPLTRLARSGSLTADHSTLSACWVGCFRFVPGPCPLTSVLEGLMLTSSYSSYKLVRRAL
jgi:hypothetical protein